MRNNVRWSVYPRYSAGSPAQVDEATARLVARDEREGYAHAIAGRRGYAERRVAETLGLGGVVFCLLERRGLFETHDELTDVRQHGVRPEAFALDRVMEAARRAAIIKGVDDGD